MDFNVELEIKEETEISERELYDNLKEFCEENPDLEGITKIQIDETMSYLSKRLGISEDE